MASSTPFENTQIKRCLVLGATGKIGSILRAYAAVAHVPIDFVWHSRTPRQASDQGQWLVWDPDQGDDLTTAIGAHYASRPDVILNLAGKTPATQGAQTDLVADTIQLTMQIVTAVKTLEIPRLIGCSSAAVYGHPRPNQTVFRESDTLTPVSEYGTAKVEMEKIMAAADHAAMTALRIGNIAGADALLGQLWNRTGTAPITLDIFASGHGPKRSYIGPKSLASVLVNLVRTDQYLPPVLNIAGQGGVYMERLLKAWQKARPGEGHYTERPALESAVESVVLDVSKLQNLMDIPVADSYALVDELLSFPPVAPR